MQKAHMLIGVGILVLINLVACNLRPWEIIIKTPPQETYVLQSVSIGSSASRNSVHTPTLDRAKNSRGDDQLQDVELWLMPTERGHDEPIKYSNVNKIKKFSVLMDGSYTILYEELPETTFVVFIVDISNQIDPVPVGFLGLESDDGNYIVEFPSRELIPGTVEFGMVSLDAMQSYVGTSSKTLSDNSGAFNASMYEELQRLAVFNNIALSAINLLENTNSSQYYAIHVGVEYRHTLGKQVASSKDVDWHTIGINVYSHDTNSTAAMFSPMGEQLSPFSPAQENSAVKWFTTIDWEKFKTLAQPRYLWELRTERGEVLAQFDLSVMIPTDIEGYPIIPLVDPTITTKDNGENVDVLQFGWYCFAPDGTTKIPLEEPALLRRLLMTGEIIGLSMDVRGGTYMYRTMGPGGCFGMQGDDELITAHSFAPDFPVSSYTDFVQLGYSFALVGCHVIWE